MRPACPHLPFRCCLSKPFPAHGGGETIRLNHMAFLHQLPQRQSPMSCLWCPPQHQAGTKQLDASPCHDSCLLGSIQVSPHPRGTPGQQTTLLCKTLYQPADPGPLQGCASACSPGQLFPLFRLCRKEEVISKGKLRGIVSHGASSGLSRGQEMGTYSPSESDLQKDLEAVNAPLRASVSPSAPWCHRGYLWLCLLHKWGKEAGA